MFLVGEEKDGGKNIGVYPNEKTSDQASSALGQRERKYSSIGICFRSFCLICLTRKKKRKENFFPLGVTDVRVKTNGKYKLSFLSSSAIHVHMHSQVWMIFVDRKAYSCRRVRISIMENRRKIENYP